MKAHHYIIKVGGEGDTGDDITIGYDDMTSDDIKGIGDNRGIVGSESIASEIPILGVEATQRKIEENHGVALFLFKLYKMVNDEEMHSIISWGSACNTFIIFDKHRFVTEFFPSYFKTRRFDTFISQLNNYGFKKKRWNRLEFENEYFQQGKQHLLRTIKRRNQQHLLTFVNTRNRIVP
ncbi:winged helix-turn-helix DNA-binding domain, heat shock transcription factor family protein [Tanacetum coccineum]